MRVHGRSNYIDWPLAPEFQLSEDMKEVREDENVVGSMSWTSRGGQRKVGVGILEAVSWKERRRWSERRMLESKTPENPSH